MEYKTILLYIIITTCLTAWEADQLLQLAGGVEGVDNGEGQQQLAHQFVELGTGQGGGEGEQGEEEKRFAVGEEGVGAVLTGTCSR